MRGTHGSPALARHRDAVAELMEGGEPFGNIEDAIDALPGVNTDQKAALWLFAFSLRDPVEQRLDARAHLHYVQ